MNQVVNCIGSSVACIVPYLQINNADYDLLCLEDSHIFCSIWIHRSIKKRSKKREIKSHICCNTVYKRWIYTQWCVYTCLHHRAGNEACRCKSHCVCLKAALSFPLNRQHQYSFGLGSEAQLL